MKNLRDQYQRIQIQKRIQDNIMPVAPEELNSKNQLQTINVVFSNQGFADIFNSAPLNVLSNDDKNSIYTIASALSDVKIERDDPKGFESLKEFRGLEYVGYIIQKERLDRKTGAWIRVEELRIIGAQSNAFIDTRVIYGELYRYRIKNILRVTKKIVNKQATASTRTNG